MENKESLLDSTNMQQASKPNAERLTRKTIKNGIIVISVMLGILGALSLATAILVCFF